jgi:hypothetical protein
MRSSVATFNLAVMLATLACSGGPSSRDTPLSGREDDDGRPVEGDPVPSIIKDCPAPRPERGLVRLTHQQYANTVRDLMGESVDVKTAFIQDSAAGPFENSAAALAVGPVLGGDYRRSAEALARRMTAEATRLRTLVGCDEGNDCRDRFIQAFGERAFRRPLTEDERSSFAALFEAGTSTGDRPGFAGGVQLVIEALLQSPDFLYRVEDSGLPPQDQKATVVASRLSYGLWNTMPDDTLLAAARDGQLDQAADIRAQVKRMLSDERARGMVDDFHRHWMETAAYDDIVRDPARFPDWKVGLGESLKRELSLFTRDVVFEQRGDIRALLTSPYSYVNADLARAYGIDADGLGGEFERVDLPSGERGGVLTQLGFLASHAHFDATSPIKRGAFVLRNVLCMEPPPPPPDLDATPPPPEPGLTTRTLIEKQTSGPACASCHKIINPVGFAFERYDPVGRWRIDEHGLPLDTSGKLTALAEPIDFDGALALSGAIASSEEAGRCYATHWFRYMFARAEEDADDCTLERLGQAVARDHLPLFDLVAATALTRALGGTP